MLTIKFAPANMQITDSKTIVGFLENATPDYKGRYHRDILKFTDDELEECHDQIQWMFPLHEESAFAQTYPVLTPSVVDACIKSETVKKNMILAKERMSKFYGLEFDKSFIHSAWTNSLFGRPNHNLLRITRIIRCLRFMKLDTDAKEFHALASKIAIEQNLNSKTFEYWDKALNDNVWDSLR